MGLVKSVFLLQTFTVDQAVGDCSTLADIDDQWGVVLVVIKVMGCVLFDINTKCARKDMENRCVQLLHFDE